ncbi:hypothetical protein OV208_28575 [Corallococcus sp. bb12-1]|uniref:hypothetical protein n=1 Tax=Corallococcus sp. bb12-1 TaxID=2996784 RepID=UPI0022715E76|nr:hypothetical protein [Corallococcus sp. bb12-1]MCY1045305.1 hypothetical protein [Corallococcus sp. bb12-1]
MTTTYDDLFFRTTTSDAGEIPSPRNYESPDIIPYGISPQGDPKTLFTSNYGQDVGQNLVGNGPNYIYLRTKNLSSGPQQGVASLYYSKASLLLFPDQWQDNQILTSDNQPGSLLKADSAGDIAVTESPFFWEPNDISGDHYCLISRVVTDKHENPIPQVGTYSDLTDFIIENPGFGWRNVSVVDSNSPNFNHTIQFPGKPDGGQFIFLLTCTNVPAGGSVAFSSGDAGPNPPIVVQPTVVPDTVPGPDGNRSWGTFVISNIPPNFETNITYSYWANGTKPLLGFKIQLSFQAYVAPGSKNFSRMLAPHQLGAPPELAQKLSGQRGITLGSHTTIIR